MTRTSDPNDQVTAGPNIDMQCSARQPQVDKVFREEGPDLNSENNDGNVRSVRSWSCTVPKPGHFTCFDTKARLFLCAT